MSWIKDTFTDVNGKVSFKRQSLFVIIIACLIGAFREIEIRELVALAAIIATLTVAEKSKRL